MKIKLDKGFSETGLCSWISHNTLKEILIGVEKRFNRTNELGYKITGFTIDENGIKIHKEYLK